MKQSKLEKILDYMAESYYPEHEYGDTWKERNAELRVEAKAEIKALFLEVIGKDEIEDKHDSVKSTGHWDSGVFTRNRLRAELRKKVESL